MMQIFVIFAESANVFQVLFYLFTFNNLYLTRLTQLTIYLAKYLTTSEDTVYRPLNLESLKNIEIDSLG